MDNGFYKHILVMTDFSEDSLYAVKIAGKLAKMSGCKLTILHVAHDESQLSLFGGEDFLKKVIERLDEEIDSKFENLKEEVSILKQIEVTKKIRRGIPYVEGLLEIEKGIYDLVVMGSHGNTSIKKFFYGSTVEKVARRSPVSVLITRRPRSK
ncbi:universal stress protein [Desulfothermus okinawensis JCM 13304]